MNKMINPKGFAAVEAVLIFVIVAIIGGTGYFVWNAKQKTDEVLTSTSSSQHSSLSSETKDPTVGWVTANSVEGKFSLKHPKNWVEPANIDLCGPEVLDRSIYLGPDLDSVLKCGAEYFGQIAVTSIEGEQVGAFGPDEGLYKDEVKKDVVIDGVKGQRYSMIALDQSKTLGGYKEGTKVVTYVISAKGNTYTATYVQAPAGTNPSQDVLADFETMVTKTLHFE